MIPFQQQKNDLSLECYCEHEFGGPGKNGIMCRTGRNYEKTNSCGLNEWCVGPSSKKLATAKDLCGQGTMAILVKINP